MSLVIAAAAAAAATVAAVAESALSPELLPFIAEGIDPGHPGPAGCGAGTPAFTAAAAAASSPPAASSDDAAETSEVGLASLM